jgi:DNA-binding response OmpR family regulator
MMNATDGSPTQILLVEDDELVGSYLREVLGMAGEVRWTTAVRTALGEVAAHRWDLVVCDYELADGTGPELVRELRRLDPEVATVILSAHTDGEHESSALEAGADRYLTKPISPSALLAESRALLALTGERRQAASGRGDDAGAASSSAGGRWTSAPDQPSPS